MGIKDFTKLFEPKGVTTISKLAGAGIVKDASNEIHRALKGIKNMDGLTDKYGNPTIHIKVVLCNELECRRHGIRSLWVFDHPSAHPLKGDELDKRRAVREVAEVKLAAEHDPDEIVRLRKSTYRLDPARIAEVKELLDLLGTPWTTAPHGLEAEQVCAMLTQQRDDIQYVVTADVDALVFGAKNLLKKGKGAQYDLFSLEDLLVAHSLELRDMAKIAVMLGCDFCPKVPRVGAKTVMAKFAHHAFTPLQLEVIDGVFGRQFDVSALEWTKAADIRAAELRVWLVEEKSFRSDKLPKELK